MARHDSGFDLTQGLPIVTREGKLVGLVTQGDLLRALEKDPEGKLTVLDAGGSELIVAYADEMVFDALFRMLQHNIGRLPIVSRENSQAMVGYLNRENVLSAWTRQIEEEGLREHGWIAQFMNSGNPLKTNCK